MPYIAEAQRICLKIDNEPRNAGELNYMVTKLCHEYLVLHGERYQTYNDILGALEGAKLELYRRKLGPYEDKAIKKNGDL